MFKNMKSSLLFSFFLLAISHLILLASASPAPAEASATVPEATPSAAVTPEDRVVAYIKSHLNKLNPPCFFSGYTDVSGKQVNAYEVVRTEWISKGLVPTNCVLVNTLVAAAGEKEADITDWGKVSKAFAQSVAGQVYVLLGKVVREGSVWLVDESPALKANKKVIGVQGWEIETSGKIVKRA